MLNIQQLSTKLENVRKNKMYLQATPQRFIRCSTT